MNWLIYILIFIVVLLILILFSEVRVRVLFKKDDQDDMLEINLRLFYQLIRINKKIPMIKLESAEEGIKYQSETNAQATDASAEKTSEKKNRITGHKLLEWRKQLKQILNQVRDLYPELKKFLKHVQIDKYQWESIIGTGDAVNTAVLTGVIWGLKGSLLGLITAYVKLAPKPFIKVIPEYSKEIFQSRFECILRFRVGYLIFTGIRILFKFLQGGRKKWQKNIPSKA